MIDACTDRPLNRVEPPLLDALRLGAYQLLRTRVPPHAAVDTTVELVRADAGSRAAGFVNAVLRRVGEHGRAGLGGSGSRPTADEDPVGHAAFAHAHPRWIAQAFADALGARADRDELDAALAADDARPSVHLLARPGEITAEELAAGDRRRAARRTRPTACTWSRAAATSGSSTPSREGLAVVQDEGSQLVALAADPRAGRRRRRRPLARPVRRARRQGRAAGRAGRAGRRRPLDAVELSEHRAELVRRAVDGLPVTVHVADGRDGAAARRGAFDRVLVDAPCTGLGALRRRPEARWRRRPEDVAGLTAAAARAAHRGAAARAPGRRGGLRHLLAAPGGDRGRGAPRRAAAASTPAVEIAVEQLDARPACPGVPDSAPGPTVQLWPHRHGTDAMFLALLRRTR